MCTSFTYSVVPKDTSCNELAQQLKLPCLHRCTMGAALLLSALCQIILYVSAYAAGEASSVLGCKASELLTGDVCTLSTEAHGQLVRACEEGDLCRYMITFCCMLRRPQ